MVTAELAACLPVLMLVVAFAVSVVTLCNARVRVQDAAREAARAAARGDPAGAGLARSIAPGAQVAVASGGDDGQVAATVSLRVHVFARWLPGYTVTARSVAAVEPDAVESDAERGAAAAPVPP